MNKEKTLELTQDWHQSAATMKPEAEEDRSPGAVLPNWNYWTSERDIEAAEEKRLSFPVKTMEDQFSPAAEDGKQWYSDVEEPLETPVKMEEVSITVEPEVDFYLFQDLNDSMEPDEKDNKMERGRVPEETPQACELSDDQCQLTSIEQCSLMTDVKTVGEELHSQIDQHRITSKNTQQSGVSEKDKSFHGEDSVVTLNKQLFMNTCTHENCSKNCCGYTGKAENLISSGDRFADRSILQTHMQSVDMKEKQCECQYCGRKFRERSYMRNHILAVHRKENGFECQPCGQTFSERMNMQAHIQAVHVERFECQLCGDKFHMYSDMQKHIQVVHLNEKRLECQHCGEKFGLNSDLEKHIQVAHLNEKRFKCQSCGQSYGRSGMHGHIYNVHLNKKGFECLQCRRFECKYCGQGYSYSSTLYKHIRKVHLPEKRVECPHCRKRFIQKRSMQKHIQVVHLSDRIFNY